MKEAIDGTATNFTCQLFKLLLKADVTNTGKLASVYQIEAEMVKIYKTEDLPHPISFQDIEDKAIATLATRCIK